MRIKTFKIQDVNGSPRFKIIFPFKSETVQLVKSLPSRKYHPKGQFWTTPVDFNIGKQLYDWGFLPHPTVKEFFKSVKIKKVPKSVNVKDRLVAAGLWDRLRPFQRIGVGLIEYWKGRVLLADEMGLGKTVQALAWAEIHPSLRPILIVVPASLKVNWYRETLKWTSIENIQILYGTAPYKITGEVVIINYDILHYWRRELIRYGFRLGIIDEVHKIKNGSIRGRNAPKRTKAALQIFGTIRRIINISGTPILSRPIEIFNAVNMIRPDIFPDRWLFGKRFCDLKNTGYGWDFNGHSNLDELNDLLTNNIMIRRLKKDVLKELPPKSYNLIPMEIDNRGEYEKAENDYTQWIRDNVDEELQKQLAEFMKKYGIDSIDFGSHKLERVKAEKVRKATAAEILTQRETLKQVAVRGKINTVKEWIRDFLESGEKLVVFGVHRFLIEALLQEFGVIAVGLYGGMSDKAKQKAQDEFQNNPNVKLFIANIQSGGVGITLTAASNVAVLELPANPGEIVQAIDRVHRITQKFAVNVWYLMAMNTIEEELAMSIHNKEEVVDKTIDGGFDKNKSVVSVTMKRKAI